MKKVYEHLKGTTRVCGILTETPTLGSQLNTIENLLMHPGTQSSLSLQQLVRGLSLQKEQDVSISHPVCSLMKPNAKQVVLLGTRSEDSLLLLNLNL